MIPVASYFIPSKSNNHFRRPYRTILYLFLSYFPWASVTLTSLLFRRARHHHMQGLLHLLLPLLRMFFPQIFLWQTFSECSLCIQPKIVSLHNLFSSTCPQLIFLHINYPQLTIFYLFYVFLHSITKECKFFKGRNFSLLCSLQYFLSSSRTWNVECFQYLLYKQVNLSISKRDSRSSVCFSKKDWTSYLTMANGFFSTSTVLTKTVEYSYNSTFQREKFQLRKMQMYAYPKSANR